MDTVSVIIPVYNRDYSLRDAIESVIIQSYKPSEIIVIDDGSFFNIEDILKNYKSHIKFIKLNNNKGVSSARNEGIKIATGNYIAFLDSDDIFLPKKIETQLKFMQDNNFLISHTNEFWYKKDRYINQGKTNDRYGGDILDKILDKCRISPSSLMVHKSIFDNTGLFNEDLKVCEDYEFSMRVALKYNVGYLKNKLIIKRAVEENSLSASIKHIEYIRYNILNDFYNQNKDKLSINHNKVIKNEIKRKENIVKVFLQK